MLKKSFLIAIGLFFCFFTFAQNGKPDALKLYRDGNYVQAIEVCEGELQSNPNNIESYVVLCWSLIANKQYSEAEVKAAAARKLSSTDVRLIEVLAEAKFYLGKNNEALNLFQRYVSNVAEDSGRYGLAYYLMGEIYIRQAKYEHADIAFSTAVNTEPIRAQWWARLGYAKEMTKDYRNALESYERALKLNAYLQDAARGKTRCQEHLL